MASKQTYECYVCKRNGFENIRVYLDGRTEDGKTIYKNEDMTLHQHKQQSAQQATVSTTTQHVTQSATKDYPPILNVLSAKVDRIIALLEKLEKERV